MRDSDHQPDALAPLRGQPAAGLQAGDALRGGRGCPIPRSGGDKQTLNF